MEGLSVSASWAPDPSASLYVVERRAQGEVEWAERIVVSATSCAFAESIADTRYEVAVTGVSGASVMGEPSDIVLSDPTVTPVPSPPLPTKPVVTATSMDGGVDLSWTLSTHATEHRVQITDAANPTEAQWSQVYLAAADEGTVQIGNLVNGRAYLARVVGYNGHARASDPVSFTPTPPAEVPPATVTGLSLTPGVRSLEAEWDGVDGAASYQVNSGRDGVGWEAVASSGQTHLTLAGLEPLTTYRVRVRAVSASGLFGEWSGTALATTLASAPAAPASITGVGEVGAARLNVAPVQDAISYPVLRSDTSGGVYTEVLDSPTPSLSIAQAGGSTKWYKAQARNAGGTSAATAAVSVVALSPPPPPPPVPEMPGERVVVVPAGPRSPLLYCQTAVNLAQSGWMSESISGNVHATRMAQADLATLDASSYAAAAEDLADQFEAVGYYADRGDEGGYAGSFFHASGRLVCAGSIENNSFTWAS